MLLTLEKLELLNFGGLKGGIDIEFKDGITFIRGRNSWPEGDSNGTLKTTLLNAVCWGLFGRTPKGATKFEVIHRGAETARVTLVLGELSVARTITGSGERLEFSHLGLLHSSIAPTKKDYRIRHVQEELNKYLGIDYNLFCNAIFVGPSSKTLKFLQAEPGERAKMLSVLVDAEVFSVAGDLIKATLKERQALLQDISRKIEFCQQRDIEVDDDLDNLRQSLEEMRKKNKERANYSLRETNRIKREFKAAKAALNKAPSADMETLAAEKTKVEKFIKAKGKELYSAQVQHKKMGDFHDSDTCPTCTQSITEEHKKEVQFIKDTLLDRIKSWTIDIANAEEELEEIKEAMEECREEHRAKVNAKQEMARLKAELAVVKDMSHTLESTPLESMLKEKEDYKATNLLQLKELTHQQQVTKQRMEYLELGKSWMTGDIRNFMFDSIRHKLAHYVNDYLKFLSGDGWEVTFPVDLKREKFDIAIFNQNIEVPKATLSEGEEWRIKMSLVLAFRSILMENVATKYGMFLLDDALGEVDEKGFEIFHKLLEREKGSLLKQVIATVPKDNLINNADRVLTITRNLNDTVEVEYDV